MQLYLISELFLVFCACLILSDTWGASFFLLSNLRKTVYGSKKGRVITLVLGFLLMLANFIFPLDPGPVFLGDFIVAVTIFINLFYFTVKFLRKDFKIDLYKKNDALGYFTLGVAVVHLLFPQIILL